MKEDNISSVLGEEASYLKYGLTSLKDEMAFHKDQMRDLPKTYRNDPRMLEALMSISATRLNRLGRLDGKPYFARIDFEPNVGQFEKIYIGKTAIEDREGKNAVIDWRAPICSLYYDSNLGESSYIAPEGNIEGDLKLKRQFIIEDDNLKEYFDVDSVSNDELLKPYMGANADNRLKTIVASIGKEQNEIIRWFADRNLIVQGVAGSGKTTVALHRAAYLLYSKKDQWKPSQLMVIGPNRYFISYISTLLPDIEAENIGQEVFEEIAVKVVGEKLKPAQGAIILDGIFDGTVDTAPQSFKASLAYKDALDSFYKNYTKALTSLPLKVASMEVLTAEEIYEMFLLQGEGLYLKQRVKNTITALSIRLLEQAEMLSKRLRIRYEPLIENSPKGEAKMNLLTKLHQGEKDIEKGCKSALEQYFAAANISATDLYKKFGECCMLYLPDNLDSESFGEGICKAMTKKQLLFEDAPAVLYYKMLLEGNGAYKDFRHVFVDEAQDLGLFHYYCLKMLFSQSTFTIVGDLAQGIYSYRSIEDWNSVSGDIFGGVTQYKELAKSYRTTVEIMEAANLPLKVLGATAAVPVIRTGDKPRLVTLPKGSFADHIVDTVEKYKEQGLVSFAIIAKTKKEATKLHKEILLLGLECDIIDEKTTVPSAVSVLTGYQSKGLEFDMVFVVDADTKHYNKENSMDMRLLFVTMSRSLHQLELLIINGKEAALEELTGPLLEQV